MAEGDDLPTIEGIENLEVIGRGGFAVVYRGHQPAFRRAVAVKVLQRSGLDADDRRRFERECQAMGALSDHPGIVTLYDAGFTTAGRPYLVMAHVAGGTLHDRLEAEGPLTWEEVTRLGVRLSGALETAHRAGVLHRDIKPGNVLRSEYGHQLSDFGIARIAGGHETRSGVITASVAHAAPEILDGEPPTARADVYSLASTLYEALTGRAAFVRDTDEGLVPLIRRIVIEPPPDLRERDVPGPVAEVIERGMAKDPGERHASAEELGLALRGAQAVLGIPVADMAVVGDRAEPKPPSRPPPVEDATVGIAAPPAAAPPPAEPPPPPAEPPSATPPPGPPTEPTEPRPGPPVPPETAPSDAAARRRRVRWLAAAAAVVVVALAAVGVLISRDGDERAAPEPTTDPEPTTEPQLTTEPQPTTDPEPTTEPQPTADPGDTSAAGLRVGVVAPSIDGPHPLTDGLNQAAADFGIAIATSASAGEPAEEITDLISSGQTTIVALAQDPNRSDVVDAVASAAEAHPEVTFVLLDDVVDAPNVVSITFADEQGAFLMGAAAALVPDASRVGFLGGADTERVRRFEAGYVAGVRHVAPAIQVDVRYLPGIGESFGDDEAALALASEMYDAGARVIVHAGTSGSGLFQAAAEREGVWAIGVDGDQTLAADPGFRDRILTSLVKRYDTVAYDTIAAAIDGVLPAGLQVVGLAGGQLEWSNTGGAFDQIVPDLVALLDDVVAGRIVVPSTVERRALAPLGPTCPPEGCMVRIVSIEPTDGELQLTLEANWEMSIQGMHAHYFWSPRYSPAQVGNDSPARFGVPSGDWDLDDRYPLYVTEGEVSLSRQRPEDTDLCVTAADAGHNVLDPDLFDCAPLAGLV